MTMPLPTWMPDLGSLDLFLSVEELGSVGKAAQAHGISQPAASTKLRRMERQVGLSLLARSTSGSTLTPVGHVFAAWAQGVVAAAASLGENVKALGQSRSAKLRVAASLTIAEYLLPLWLLSLRRVEPSLDVSAVVANSLEVCDRVRSGQVELGFVEMPTVPADLTHAEVGTDRLVFVAAPDYPAARSKQPLRVCDLLSHPVLLRESGSGTRDTFIEAITRALHTDAVVELPHAVELGSTTTILATARGGGGIGVISERAASADLDNGSLVEVNVHDVSAIRPLNAIWMGETPSLAASLLIDITRR